jgi:hypothetical protein
VIVTRERRLISIAVPELMRVMSSLQANASVPGVGHDVPV